MAKRHTNKVGDLESLFLRLEELVLANSGEDEFEEILKLVIAKLWDERTNGGSVFLSHGSGAKTFQAIRGLLRDANNAWPGILTSAEPNLTPEHLDVCVSALAQHRIGGQDLEVMDSFFEFLNARAAKGTKGQYFTPRYVIELCVRMLRPTPEDTILDPACGSGGFLVHALNYIRSENTELTSDMARISQANLWGFDIDPRAIQVAKALMILAGGNGSNMIRLNSLLTPAMPDLFTKKTADDSLLMIEDICRSRLRKHKGFDLILTNPPFAGEVRERQLLDSYSLGEGKPRVERDVLFVERCVNLLKPGGRMAIVLPHNKLAADSESPLRNWVLRNSQVLAVVGLGRNTFLPHTHQKASVLFLRKNLSGNEQRRDYPIFFAISEKDGKNRKGQLELRSDADGKERLWDRIDHDLDQIVEQYHAFTRTDTLQEA